MTGTRTAVTVVIEGEVQGVGFRFWTVQLATALGLDGWVRNRYDGTVEALFIGPAPAVDAMIAACYRGPPHATVRDLRITAAAPTPVRGFSHLPTL
ncbi:MAG: acylphosphatase [Azospirillaceae bacterium]|nr:acylphosphatase [Azospirillaceae bacterium]